MVVELVGNVLEIGRLAARRRSVRGLRRVRGRLALRLVRLCGGGGGARGRRVGVGRRGDLDGHLEGAGDALGKEEELISVRHGAHVAGIVRVAQDNVRPGGEAKERGDGVHDGRKGRIVEREPARVAKKLAIFSG